VVFTFSKKAIEMNFKLSDRSLERAKDVNPKLINLFLLAIRRTPIDFGVAWMGGKRTPEEQNQLFKEGYSQCDGYLKLSKHQSGDAIDLNAFVGQKMVDNKEMLCVVAGVMFACASELNIKIRWGLDWNSDGNILDNKFNDQYHFELIN
jgi:peptidoglycan L-alanyl-D-glutamate endopeptidase CwlK